MDLHFNSPIIDMSDNNNNNNMLLTYIVALMNVRMLIRRIYGDNGNCLYRIFALVTTIERNAEYYVVGNKTDVCTYLICVPFIADDISRSKNVNSFPFLEIE
jgi:hypothetical protein